MANLLLPERKKELHPTRREPGYADLNNVDDRPEQHEHDDIGITRTSA